MSFNSDDARPSLFIFAVLSAVLRSGFRDTRAINGVPTPTLTNELANGEDDVLSNRIHDNLQQSLHWIITEI